MFTSTMPPLAQQERGFAIPVALVFLLLLSIIGVSGLRTSLLESRMSNNYRDRVIALSAAEAALADAGTVLKSMELYGDQGVITSGGRKVKVSFDARCSNGFCRANTTTGVVPWEVDDNWNRALKYSGTYEDLKRKPEYLIDFLTATNTTAATLQPKRMAPLVSIVPTAIPRWADNLSIVPQRQVAADAYMKKIAYDTLNATDIHKWIPRIVNAWKRNTGDSLGLNAKDRTYIYPNVNPTTGLPIYTYDYKDIIDHSLGDWFCLIPHTCVSAFPTDDPPIQKLRWDGDPPHGPATYDPSWPTFWCLYNIVYSANHLCDDDAVLNNTMVVRDETSRNRSRADMWWEIPVWNNSGRHTAVFADFFQSLTGINVGTDDAPYGVTFLNGGNEIAALTQTVLAPPWDNGLNYRDAYSPNFRTGGVSLPEDLSAQHSLKIAGMAASTFAFINKQACALFASQADGGDCLMMFTCIGNMPVQFTIGDIHFNRNRPSPGCTTESQSNTTDFYVENEPSAPFARPEVLKPLVQPVTMANPLCAFSTNCAGNVTLGIPSATTSIGLRGHVTYTAYYRTTSQGYGLQETSRAQMQFLAWLKTLRINGNDGLDSPLPACGSEDEVSTGKRLDLSLLTANQSAVPTAVWQLGGIKVYNSALRPIWRPKPGLLHESGVAIQAGDNTNTSEYKRYFWVKSLNGFYKYVRNYKSFQNISQSCTYRRLSYFVKTQVAATDLAAYVYPHVPPAGVLPTCTARAQSNSTSYAKDKNIWYYYDTPTGEPYDPVTNTPAGMTASHSGQPMMIENVLGDYGEIYTLMRASTITLDGSGNVTANNSLFGADGGAVINLAGKLVNGVRQPCSPYLGKGNNADQGGSVVVGDSFIIRYPPNEPTFGFSGARSEVRRN